MRSRSQHGLTTDGTDGHGFLLLSVCIREIRGSTENKRQPRNGGFELVSGAGFDDIGRMTATKLANELKAVPAKERAKMLSAALCDLYPKSGKFFERLVRRVEHPEIPEDIWQGFEECEDGKAIEMKEEHFDQPPL